MKKIISLIGLLFAFPLLVYAATYNGATTGPELDYVHGVTSGIQAQINAKQDTITSSTDLTAKSLTVAKQKGIAGINARYEAYSTNTQIVGEIGPASMTANTSYLLRDPAAGATAANQVKACTNAGETGTGTSADPYIQACSWVTPLLTSALGTGVQTALGNATNGTGGLITYGNAAGTAAVLTGFTSGAGTVAATDTILQAVQKLDGNVAGKQAAGTYLSQTSSQWAHGAVTDYFTLTDNGNSGTSKTIDWRLGNHQKITTTGSCTLTFTAPAGATALQLEIIHENSATAYTYTWPAAVLAAGGVATGLATSNTANAVDLVSCMYDGTNYLCGIAANLTH